MLDAWGELIPQWAKTVACNVTAIAVLSNVVVSNVVMQYEWNIWAITNVPGGREEMQYGKILNNMVKGRNVVLPENRQKIFNTRYRYF